MAILQAEMQGGTLQDAVSSEDLYLLLSDLDIFTREIAQDALKPDADPSVRAFSQVLDRANSYYRTLSLSWHNEISGQNDRTLSDGPDF